MMRIWNEYYLVGQTVWREAPQLLQLYYLNLGAELAFKHISQYCFLEIQTGIRCTHF
jgi:hypothetical protein